MTQITVSPLHVIAWSHKYKNVWRWKLSQFPFLPTRGRQFPNPSVSFPCFFAWTSHFVCVFSH
uniref:Uncharacterized protein n=1 Tax=Anguilla anguilla TaxID=7936 RepID=A0A0E9P6L1_ANGAN